MSLDFQDLNQELQQIISEEICKAENGATDRNIYQLRTILKELLMMERQCGVILNYPHIIVDSWGYSDVLGNRLMKLASMYDMYEKMDITL